MKDIIVLNSGAKVIYCDKIKGYRKITTLKAKGLELLNKLEQRNKNKIKFYTLK